MATTREVMNKVLRGLRQFGLILDSGTTVTTDDYLLMILQFVNEAKEEIEESGWPWQALRQTVTVTLVADQIEYDITIAGDADVDTNDRTRLLYDSVTFGGPAESFRISTDSRPQVFETSTSNEYRVKEWTQEKMERIHFTDENNRQLPSHFTIWSDGDSIKMKVWPTPDKTYTFKMRLFIPQAELAADSLEATSLTIPQRPVWTKALWKANQERGDELGAEGSTLHQAYTDAHGSAVGKEMSPADSTVHLER